jgi:hypothetical protein
MGAAGTPSLGELPHGVHTSEVLATIRLDDDRRVQPRRVVPIPDEELATITLESDFDDVGHLYPKRRNED